MIQLVDCHAHIQGGEYDEDRSRVLLRARDAGLAAIVVSGTDVASSRAAIHLAESDPHIWASAGIHPHDAAGVTPSDYDRIEEMARSARVVAIGEIGLDFYRDLSPRAVQRQVFEEQLALADRLDLPVVIHSRDADEDTIAILRPWAARRQAAGRAVPFGVMHCYAYGSERLHAYTALNLYISIPGTVTYPKATLMHSTAQQVPADRFVVETDCPYLTPQSRRGRRNEPSLLPETVAAVAVLRSESVEVTAAQSTANAQRLYRFSLDMNMTRRATSAQS